MALHVILRNPALSIVATSTYLLVYTVLFQTDVSLRLALFLFLLSPFLVLWVVYSILRYGRFDGPELRADQEWGYQDRPSGGPGEQS